MVAMIPNDLLIYDKDGPLVLGDDGFMDRQLGEFDRLGARVVDFGLTQDPFDLSTRSWAGQILCQANSDVLYLWEVFSPASVNVMVKHADGTNGGILASFDPTGLDDGYELVGITSNSTNFYVFFITTLNATNELTLRIRKFTLTGVYIQEYTIDLGAGSLLTFDGQAPNVIGIHTFDVDKDGNFAYIATPRYLYKIALIVTPTITTIVDFGAFPDSADTVYNAFHGIRCDPTDADKIYTMIGWYERHTVPYRQIGFEAWLATQVTLHSGDSYDLIFTERTTYSPPLMTNWDGPVPTIPASTLVSTGDPHRTVLGDVWNIPWDVAGAVSYSGPATVPNGQSITIEIIGANPDASQFRAFDSTLGTFVDYADHNPMTATWPIAHSSSLTSGIARSVDSYRIPNQDLSVGLRITNHGPADIVLGRPNVPPHTPTYNIGQLLWDSGGDWQYTKNKYYMRAYTALGVQSFETQIREDVACFFTTFATFGPWFGVDEDGTNVWVLLPNRQYIGWKNDANVFTADYVVPVEAHANGGQSSVQISKTELYKIPTDGSAAVEVVADFFPSGGVSSGSQPIWVYRTPTAAGTSKYVIVSLVGAT